MTHILSQLRTNLWTSAATLALAVPLWAGAALAQETQDAEGSQETQAQGTEQADQGQQAGDAGQQGQGQDAANDVLIATIGDAEIRNSDILRAIGDLPPPLNAQPPEMLVPMALQQLLLREAIVQEARSQGLGEDPEVRTLVEGATQAAEEDALVQVWLQRELENRVTPEAVDQAYAGLEAMAGDQPLPPLEELRPQLEQSLAQQAFGEIQASLLSNADITVYGPDGQPLEQPTAGAGGQASGGEQAGGEQAGGDQAGGEGSAGDQAMPEDGDAAGGEGGTDQESSDN